ECCRFYINKILAVVAKVTLLQVQGTVTFPSVNVSREGVRMVCSSDFAYEATQELAVSIRPRSLFRMMEQYSISQLSIPPNQSLQLIGISEKDMKSPLNLEIVKQYEPISCKLDCL